MSTKALTVPGLAAAGLTAYGLLAMPLAVAALPIYVHLPNLYSAVLGMNLGLLGLVLLAARLADAFVDPLIGALYDRLQRPAPVIALGVVLLAAGLLIAFNPPQGAPLWAWLSAALVPVYLGYSLASIGYLAWGSLLGDTPHERTRVTAFREGFGLAGVVLASVLPSLLAERADTALARFSVVLAVALAVCAAFTLLTAPRPARVAVQTGPRTRAILAPFANPAFVRLFLVFMLNGIASAVPATLVLFFIRDRLVAPSYEPLFLASYFAAGALSIPLWVRTVATLGLARTWLLGMALAIVTFAWAGLLGAGDVWAFVAVCVASGCALGADLALPGALLAGVIQRAGHAGRLEGLYFGWWNFATKLNLALAAGVALPALAALGYRPGSREPAALQALTLAYCLLPCLLKCAAAALLYTRWIRR